VSSPVTRISAGTFDGQPVVYWAWRFDGYVDVHVTEPGQYPDGSEPVSELHPTVADARRWVREWNATERMLNF